MRPRRAPYVGASLLIVLVQVAGVFLFALTRPAALSFSPKPVAAGDHVVVSATHLPHGQAGYVDAFGSVHDFTADASGNADIGLDVPAAISPGGYVVKICWNGSCPVEAILNVTQPVAAASPSASPASSPAHSPVPTPVASPVASPTPLQPELAVQPSGQLAPGAAITVGGLHFYPGRGVTIYFVQSANTKLGVILVQSSGSFTGRFYIPGRSIAKQGRAAIEACDYTARCVFAVIAIS
jgi:hypothetical protein